MSCYSNLAFSAFTMIYIIDFGSSKAPQIAAVISSLGYTYKVFKWNENIDFKNASGFILSGAPVLFTETDSSPYLQAYSFLKKIERPVLGICFGHQLLGVLYGAKVFKGKAIRTPVEISLLKEDKLFEGFSKSIVFEEDHTEGIDLPVDFIRLAASADYKVEAMKHPEKKIYGVQFHPEVSGEKGKQLLNNFCKKCF